MIGVGLVLRVAEEARVVEEAANAEDEQAEKEELIALGPEVIILGHTRHGEQPATDFWVATSAQDGASQVDPTQEEEEEQAAT